MSVFDSRPINNASGLFGPAESYLLAKMLSEVSPESKFTGESLKYMSFMNGMNRLAAEYSGYPGMLLEVLMNRCDKDALEAIKFCTDIHPPSQAFKEAMNRLELFYGNKMDILDSHMKNVGRKDMVKYDIKGFQKLLTELHNFRVVVSESEHRGIMHSPNLIRKIIYRLPYKSREVLSRDLERAGKEYPSFEQLLAFVEAELKHVTNPFIRKSNDEDNKKPSGQHRNRAKNHGNQRDGGIYVNTAQSSGKKEPPAYSKSCYVCKGDKHGIYKCEKFLSNGIKERWNIVNKLKLCHACLKPGHMKGSEKCTTQKSCKSCGSKMHNTLLCQKKSSDAYQGTANGTNRNSDESSSTTCLTQTKDVRLNALPSRSLLPVVPVVVKLPGEREGLEVNALIDSGCDSTLCSNSLIERLGCNVKKKYRVWVNHACGAKQLDAQKVEALDIRGRDESSRTYHIRDIEALPELPRHGNPTAEANQINNYRFPYLKDIVIPELKSREIDIIVGTNNEHLLVLEDRRGPDDGNGPAAWLTPLGWTLVGKDYIDKGLEQESHQLNCAFIMQQMYESGLGDQAMCEQLHTYNAVCSGNENTCELLHEEVQQVLQGELEAEDALDEEEAPSKEDTVALRIMEEGATFNDGRWTVPLPLKQKKLNLPDNRKYAVKRLLAVRNMLLRKPDLAEFYKKKMEDLQRNFLEDVPEGDIEDLDCDVWHIVHFCTMQIKPRIVYDGPAMYLGRSLNACLYQGPDNLQHLTDVLIRFRQDKVAFVCDIKEMFLQIEIPANQRNLIRILWFKDGNLNGPIITLRFKRLPYGLNCSIVWQSPPLYCH